MALKTALKLADRKRIQFEQDKQKPEKYRIPSYWENEDKLFSNELGELLEKIKQEDFSEQDEFLSAISREYGKALTAQEKDKLLQTFQVKFLHKSKVAYIRAVERLLEAKALAKDDTLPDDIERVVQLAEEIKITDLVEYLFFQEYLSYFYYDTDKVQRAVQVQSEYLSFYESADKDKKDRIRKSWVAGKYGDLSWYQLLAKQPQFAIASAKKGIEYSPEKEWIKGNLAHGYLFTNQLCEAERIHLAMKGEEFEIHSTTKTWKEAALEDFNVFEEKGITHPDIEKIKTLLETGKPSPECTPVNEEDLNRATTLIMLHNNAFWLTPIGSMFQPVLLLIETGILLDQ